MKHQHTMKVLAIMALISFATISPAQQGGPRFGFNPEQIISDISSSTAAWVWDTDPLPADWSGFAGVRSSKGTLLRWVTSSEHHSAWFKIEFRKISGGEWQVADVVPAAGESTTPRFYSWLHSDSPVGEFEYRLRQIDRYGNETVTEALRIEANSREGFTLSPCYPNPANTETLVSIGATSKVTATLVIADLLGQIRQVVFQEQEMLPGSYRYRIDTANLPSGKYLLRLSTSEGVSTRRVVISR